MTTNNRLQKRIMETKESTLEWICTFLFITAFLGLVLVYIVIENSKPSLGADLVYILWMGAVTVYFILFYSSLSSFFVSPDNKDSIYDIPDQVSFFKRHEKIRRVTKVGMACFFVILFADLGIKTFAFIYELLQKTTEISEIVVAIMVAVLLEHFFQLLGIGFAKILKN